jgi:hypothetical protein
MKTSHIYVKFLVNACHQVYYRVLLHVHPLLGNGVLNTFPQKQKRGTVWRLLLGNKAVNTSAWAVTSHNSG